MNTLLFRGARVLTLVAGGGPLPRLRRREQMRDLGVLARADVLVSEGHIVAIDQDMTFPPGGKVIEADGRVLMPAFIDCHTHACFAGTRTDEWARRLRGETYLEILKAGGGIMSTVRATRAASTQALTESLRARLWAFLKLGTATIEVKSGYGLTAEHELRMLEAISLASTTFAGSVIPTALLGHAVDPEISDLPRRVISEALPQVSKRWPGIAIDLYCEQGAWTLDDSIRLIEAAGRAGHPVRVHADQFNSLGLTREAIARGARSVDHLEALAPGDRVLFADSPTSAVILPSCGFHLDGRYADGRALIDAGAALCIATNFNPGSAPCQSMPMAMALAVRHCGLLPEEAIVAATANPAAMLGLRDRGMVAPGMRADLLLLDTTDERDLACRYGDSCVASVYVGGRHVNAGMLERAM